MEVKMRSSAHSRRGFLRGALLATGAGVLAACGATPAPAATATSAPAAATQAPAAEATATSAPATPAAASGEKAVVKVFECCWDGEHIEAGKKLYETFRQANPDLDIQDFWPPGSQDWGEQFLTSVAGGDHWDVTFWCSSPFAFLDQGKLLDLNPLIEADTEFDGSDFYDYMTETWVDDQGHRFGWPANYATTLLYYNTKMFADAGVNPPSADYTWDDVRDMATKLTKDTGDPSTQVWGCLFRRVDLEHMAQGWGCNFVDPDAKRCDFTKKETTDALQFFSDMIYNDKIWPTAEQTAGQDEVAMFASQKTAMVGLPEWGLLEFNRAHEEQGLEYDVTLMPVGPVKRTTRVRPSAMSLFSDTPNPEASWRVGKFILSPEYEKALMVDIPEAPPSRKSVNEYKVESLTYPPGKEVFLQTADYGIFPYYDKRYGKEMSDIINPILDQMLLGSERDMVALGAAACEQIDAKFAEL